MRPSKKRLPEREPDPRAREKYGAKLRDLTLLASEHLVGGGGKSSLESQEPSDLAAETSSIEPSRN